jgi:hypothetical protein
MKLAVLTAVVGLALAAVGGASAEGKTVQVTLTGKCTEVDTLDKNGALKYATNTCITSARCKCAGSTRLDFQTVERESGTGAPGRETGTLVASGPLGKVTLILRGTQQALMQRGVPVIQETGTWTRGPVTGYSGVQLATRGTYKAIITTNSTVTGSKVSLVHIAATFGCWRCSAT